MIAAKSCKCETCLAIPFDPPQPLTFVQKIHKEYGNQRSCSSDRITGVKLKLLVGFLALTRTWSDEKLEYLVPFGSKNELLWPTTAESYAAVDQIYRESLIQVDLNYNRTDSFKEKTDGRIVWFTSKSTLIPSIVVDGKLLDIPTTQNFLTGLLPAGLSNAQKTELPSLMMSIAVDECVQYFEYMLNEHQFDSETSDKTKLVFEELLQELPVNQVLGCIWTAVKSAAAFFLTPACHGRPHAYNSIPGKLRDAADKKVSASDLRPGFDRNKHIPRSEISFTLYDLLEFDTDVGFTTKIKEIPIPAEWLSTDEEYGDADDFDYLNFDNDEKLFLESIGFSVFHNFDAQKTFIFSSQTAVITKTKDRDDTVQFNISIKVNPEVTWNEFRAESFDAVKLFVLALTNNNAFIEGLAES